LILLNDPMVHDVANQWAARFTSLSNDRREQITVAYLSAFGRAPSETEVTAAEEFLVSHPASKNGDGQQAWRDLAHAFINAKEFMFIR
ncbi:MAG TPA: hypothetical protein DDW52_09120, partial [Planctomycetaceae bacterium]|nr:hypothetical protein [Planctomycetaceae bacterium]